MKPSRLAAIALASLAASFTASAQASVITYDLTDTPHGAAGLFSAGFYQHVGGNPAYDSLSFEQNGADVSLSYDSLAGTASLGGTAYNINTDTLVGFDLNYANVTLAGDTLTLNDMTLVGAFGGTSVNGKGFNLTLGETLTGHGWLNNADAGGHFGDFHFAGTKTGGCIIGEPDCSADVPIPATGFLILAGLAGIAGRRLKTRRSE